jgi:seryl-tRNA synthetase
MIDIKIIRENPELVKENIRKKFQDEKIPLVDELVEKDKESRELMQESQNLRHERNELTSQINELKKKGKDAKQVIEKAKKIPDRIKEIEERQTMLAGRVQEILYQIPNIIHKSVPIGKDSNENVVRQTIGKPKEFKFEVKQHGEIAEQINGADFDSARDTSGKGFYFLKGELALLDMALINYARDFMIKKGFLYMQPPLMIRKKVVEGVMSFKEMENMMYKIEGEDLYMIGTSEHPLIGMFIDKTIDEKNLPIKITGFSACFRKEIGAHGIDEKGLFRVHQFNKQEMIVICKPEESYKWYDFMLNCTVEIFKSLELPVRVLECCSGDLADLKAKSADTEAWSPRQKKYFEVGSVTNMEEAQARRLGIKIQGKENKYYAHTLNNTVIATSRALVAILENYQNIDGSITVPKVLVPYMNGITKIGGKKEEQKQEKEINKKIKSKAAKAKKIREAKVTKKKK